MHRMGLFKLGKRRESRETAVSGTPAVTGTSVTTVTDNAEGGLRVQEQRTTQISILIGENKEMNITGSSISPAGQTDSGDAIIQDIVPARYIDAGTAVADEPLTEMPAEDSAVEEKGEMAAEAAAEEKTEEKKPDTPVTVPKAEPVPKTKADTEKVGVIYGNVGTSGFDCRVCSHLERAEYVMVNHEDYGPVLCQVGSLIRKSNLTLNKSLDINNDTKITDVITAHVDVIGYRDDRGLLLTPRTTFMAGSDVLRADAAFVKKVLGLEINPKTDGYIGILHGHEIPVALNINELLQRHACILAKTGGGKSYMSGDIIEELMKHNVTCMIIDPHGEYGAMRDVGKPGDPRFRVKPRSYKSRIREFAVSNDSGDKNIKPLRFTFRTLEAKEILELMRSKDPRTYLSPLKRALEKVREKTQFYSVRDVIDVLNADPENKMPALVSELEYIDEMGVFAPKGNAIDQLIETGKATIINLKGVAPDIQQLIVKRLSTVAFEMRKKGTVPPMMMVIEEAHNYCPQGVTVLSSKPLATIASEGRKFGLGLMVISQRPAKIDKNVLSQCGTQIILKVTNPNDVKAIAQSIEGLTNGMTDEIQTMPIGMAMIVGAGIESPLLVEVRPRESRHGGAGIKVLEESD